MGITFEELKTTSNSKGVSFESLQKEEEEIKGISFESLQKLKEEEGVGIGENIWRTAVGALRDVGQGTIDFTDWIESKIPTALQAGLVKTEEDGYQVLTGQEYVNAKESLRSKGIKSINLPKVPEPEYFGGSFIRDLTGFVIPFSRLKLLNPTSVLGKGTEIVARGTVAEQLAFSPFEQRLSNLAAEYGPEFSKPLANYLKADINDTESEARFKMAIEGTIFAGTIESVIALAKSVKNMRSVGKKEAAKPKEIKIGDEIIVDSKGNKGIVKGINLRNEKMGVMNDNYVIKGEGTRSDWVLDREIIDKLNKIKPIRVEETQNLSKQIEEIEQPYVEKVKVQGKDIDIPVRPIPISPTSNWKPQWYNNFANKIIDYTRKKFPNYLPLKSLPKQDKYLKLRGIMGGKLQQVRDLAENVFLTFGRLGDADNLRVYNYLIKQGDETLKGINPVIKENADKLRKAIDDIGQKLIKNKILTKKTVDSFEGSYLPRVFLKYLGKNQRLGYKIQRKDLDDFTKQFLGEIKDVSLLGSKAIADPMGDIVRFGFLREVAKDADWTFNKGLVRWGDKDVSPVWLNEERNRIAKEITDGQRLSSDQTILKEMDTLIKSADENIGKTDLNNFRKLPTSDYYGSLKGAYVRKEIYDDLVTASDFRRNKDNLAQSILGDQGSFTQVTKLWKYSKVALNPPTQVRNFVSNVILLNLSGVRWVDMPKRLTAAIDDIRKNGPFTQIAKKYGVNNTTFSKQEMVQINKAYLEIKAAKGNYIDKIKFMGGKLGDLGSRAYQFTELLGKTVKIMDDMAKGVSEADAVLAAQKTLFDYSLVPPSVRYLRNAPVGMPFITFYYKVLPNLLETAIRNPERYLPYVAVPYALHTMLAQYKGVTKDDLESLRKTLPDYLRNRGNALIMPVKDDSGRWQVFDFSYFLPWSMFTGMANDVASGDVQRFFVDTGILGGPLPQLITAVLANKDPFTNREIANPADPPSTQVADSMMYLWRMTMPTWLTDIGFAGRMKQALDKDVNKYGDPKITMTQAALRLVGFNVYPIDAQKSRSENIKRMKYELQQIKSRRTKTLKDKNLTKEERDKIRNKYSDLIKQRIDQLREYREESTIPKELR